MYTLTVPDLDIFTLQLFFFIKVILYHKNPFFPAIHYCIQFKIIIDVYKEMMLKKGKFWNFKVWGLMVHSEQNVHICVKMRKCHIGNIVFDNLWKNQPEKMKSEKMAIIWKRYILLEQTTMIFIRNKMVVYKNNRSKVHRGYLNL